MGTKCCTKILILPKIFKILGKIKIFVSRAMRGAEGTTWDGIPSESPPQAGIFLSFTITKMGWESLSLMMVMRWDGKHEEMH